MTFTQFFQSLAGGVLIGGVYSLVAIGLTIIYGVLKIVNFAHGDFLMLAMYLAFFSYTLLKIDPYLMAFIALPLFFILGIVIYKIVIQPIVEKGEEHIQILLTMGLAWVLENIVLYFFGPDYRSLKLPYGDIALSMGNVYFSLTKIFACAGAVVCTLLVHLLFKRTRLGKAIRAAAQESRAAYMVGVNVKRIYFISFAIGICCVSIAGFLVMPFFYTSPLAGAQFTLIAFVVVVLGGLGSFAGALICGFLVGVVEGIGSAFLPGSYQELVVFSVFVLILLFKPCGIFVRNNG